MAEMTKCEVCEKPTSNKCGKCWKVFYCSREHQQASWKMHQNVCRPFKVCTNEQLGRYIVATKPIKEGDVVLQELHLVAIPNKPTRFVCMGCLKYTTNVQPCKKCGWSVCNEECQNNPNHEAECYYFAKSGNKVAQFSQIIFDSTLMLKCLYYEKLNREIWKKLEKLESHCGEAGNTKFYEKLAQVVTNTIYNDFGLKDEFKQETIQKVCRLVNINCFDADSDHTTLYEFACLFEHNCKANCRKVFNSEGVIRITAATSIEEGEHLSIAYTSALRPTFKRQEILTRTKLFTCRCNRCLDVTEFGTNFSALNCKNKKCQGVLLPETFLVQGVDWTCNKCRFKMTADSAVNTYESLERAFQMAVYTMDYKAFLKNHAKLLPSNHNYMINAKIKLLFSLGNFLDIDMVSINDLTLKISLCQELTEFLKNLAPAEMGMRGDILHHHELALREMCRRKEATGVYRRADSIRILKERQSLLKEVIQISRFKYDEEHQHEIATGELKEVEDLLGKLSI